jgi:NTE family protein
MKNIIPGIISSILFSLSITNPVLAAEIDTQPKIGLVLSGGGARGAAHIGVLKILEELSIPVDYIAGTSMGAIVGGLYATGMTANEIEQAIIESDWKPLFQDRPPRADRPFRRKQDDLGFLVEFDMGVDKEGLIFPKGLVQGQNLEMTLKRLVLPVATIDDFDQLPIPFRAIATDLGSGEALAIKSGDLAMAIRASMSLPGIFKPVHYNDRVMADGGIVNNLPVQIARDMGADILIVVDIGFPLEDAKELDSALAVSRQMLTIMIVKRTHEQLSKLGPDDILISPDLGNLDSRDFQRLEEAMNLGEVKARESMNSLSTLAVSKDSYATFRQQINQRRQGIPMINRIVIENESRLSTRVIEERLSDLTDKTLDVVKLEEDIANVYGFDTFESVSYKLEGNRAGAELHIKGKEKSWGPNYLQFGINLEDDFSGTSDYNLATRLTLTELNGLGGEFRAEAQIGESPSLFAEFYQPLDYASRWFINPSAKIGRTSTTLFDRGDRIAQFRNEETELSIAAGRNFGNWGEIRIAIFRSFGDSSIHIGDPALGNSNEDATIVAARFSYDTIDSISIPKSGLNINLGWLGVRESLGSDISFDLTEVFLLKPQTWGKHTLLHWWNVAGVTRDNGNNINAIKLGGLFSFSGYAPEEVEGRYGAIGRLLYYYQLSSANLSALDTSIYIGASVEAGYFRNDLNRPQYNNLLMAGSVFVMLDTILGPVYLAYGAAEHDHRSAYLFLGQTF